MNISSWTGCGTEKNQKRKVLVIKKTNQVAQNANLASENPPPKKKKGCLIASIILLLFVIGLVFGVSQIVKNPEKYGAVPSSSITLKEFDSKSWEQYKTLYDAHNKLMSAMTSYSDGQGDKLDFYNYCKSSEEYFRKVSTAFDYGTTDDEKAYLSVFENWALSDQLAAKSLMNYLDSLKIKDLSTAQEYIQTASNAAVTIASNRTKLLKDAGYTEDEINEIINQIPSELEPDKPMDTKSESNKIPTASSALAVSSEPPSSSDTPALSSSNDAPSPSSVQSAPPPIKEVKPDESWTPYSTGNAETLADNILKGYVVYYQGQYWASPDYVSMLQNEEVVYFNDIAD